MFAKRMYRLHDDIEKRTNEITKHAAKTCLEALVVNMPVDTSQAVSNWQVSLGSPNMTSIPPHFPGKHGNTRGASSAQTLAIGRTIIDAKQPGIGTPIHITNAVDYIESIDADSSMPGFAAKGVGAANRYLAKAKLGLK